MEPEIAASVPMRCNGPRTGSLLPGREGPSRVDVDLVSLPAGGRAAGVARGVVRRQLESWGLDDLLDTAVLLTSEVVTNVIVHTASAPALGLARDGAGVRVTVVDGSPVPPRRRWHSPTATTGRGMQLLQDLADEWGWDPVGDGKAVWFLLRSDHEPAAEAHVGPAADGAVPAAAAPSPLGRYGPTGDTGDLVTVELLRVPVRVLAASREHHDSLMREFRLLALAGGPSGHDVPTRLVELTQALGMRFAAAGSRPDEDFDRALERGLDQVDLVYRVPPAAAESARELDALMGEADEFCRSAQLITLARTPVMVRFGQWYLRQFLDQIAGRPATPWDGPLDPD
jgi:anti-sigma regulatory factor (Ser/Thr protein kinase)